MSEERAKNGFTVAAWMGGILFIVGTIFASGVNNSGGNSITVTNTRTGTKILGTTLSATNATAKSIGGRFNPSTVNFANILGDAIIDTAAATKITQGLTAITADTLQNSISATLK